MGFTSIKIRDETYEALAKLKTKAFESQKGVSTDLSLSDVIDTLLEISDDQLLEDEVWEAIVITAEKED